MKNIHKKFYTISLGMLLIFGFSFQLPNKQAQAQTACSSNETSGNLFGYLETDEMGLIYLSTESWNEDPAAMGHSTTNQIFSVEFDRQNNRFQGRGWSPVAGWVDFSSNNVDGFAEFESLRPENDVNGNWGNVTPIIDISGIYYQTDPGAFLGNAFHGNETGDDDNGNFYGAGNIDFSNVSIVEPACTQFVSLTLNGFQNINQTNCPVTRNIQINWASVNANNCYINSDNWNDPVNTPLPDNYQTGNDHRYDGQSVTSTNPRSNPVTITCIGSNGENVSDSALISCGSAAQADPTTSGTVIPVFQEV